MQPVFLLRLLLDSVAAGLLLFAFSYYWQGNAFHEVVGTCMFLLLTVHGAFHRRWFAAITQMPRQRRGKFNIAITLALLGGMLALLVTSLLISETLFAQLRLADDVTARQIHVGVAYWLLVIVAIHLGLRWPMLMSISSKLVGIKKPNVVRRAVLRLFAVAIAAQGVCSFVALNLRSKLLFQMSLDWWNFEESVSGFFGHCAAFAGLCMFFTYYAMQWQHRYKRKTSV